jgi:flagellar motor protein MotB
MLRVPGTKTRQEGDATVVVFEDGLFSSGALLKPAAERILDDLGAAIKSDAAAVVIAVTGHTDDVPLRPGAPFRDDVALGLARATAVAERLRTGADLDAGALLLRSLGSREPPFPNDSREGRLRNRTVVIQIGSHSASRLENR